MDIAALKNEIDTDPVPLGYAGKTDAQIATILNDETLRDLPRGIVRTQEILDRFDKAEYIGVLSNAAKRDALGHLLGLGTLDVISPMAKTIIVEVFGAQSTTATNLTAFKVRKGSRVQELGWPTVKVGWVAKARAI